MIPFLHKLAEYGEEALPLSVDRSSTEPRRGPAKKLYSIARMGKDYAEEGIICKHGI